MAWVLGLICTDGSITGNSLSIPSIDLDMLRNVRSILGSEHTIGFGKSSKTHSIQIRSDQIVEDLNRLGVHNRKTFTLQMPNVPGEYLWHFVRGCIDGDGCLNEHFGQSGRKLLTIRLSNSSECFLKAFQSRVGLNSRIFKLSGKDHWQLAYHDRVGHAFGKMMYRDSLPKNRLERKYIIFQNHLQHCPTEQLINIGIDPTMLGRRTNPKYLLEVWPIRHLPKSVIAEQTGIDIRQVYRICERFNS